MFRGKTTKKPAAAVRPLELLRRFRCAKKGATAVEFALVAFPFFMLMFALMEVGLLFFANFTLEHALAESARKIRTGQAQTAGFDADRFKEEVCGRIVTLFDCNKDLKIDVRSFEKFATISGNLPDPLDNGELKEDFVFEMGGGYDIVVVRAFYEWDLLINVFGTGLNNMGDGRRLLEAAVTFRNEPYEQD